MRIKVNNRIRIYDVTKEADDWVAENLIIPNPDFYKKEKMGKWTGNTPRTLSLYEDFGSELWLPFGLLWEVWNLHPVYNDWVMDIHPQTQIEYKSTISLYPYQQKAVDEVLKKKNGVLVMPCGSGKTQTGLEIIARLGGRALWLTHTQDLLNQSKKRAESVLTQGGYGTITGGKVNIGTTITFATVQTLSKTCLDAYRDTWDVIMIDECQHCAGTPTRVTQFYKVISSLSARYKIGLTATPKRADGLHKAMFALLGGVMYEVTKDDVKHTTCPIKIEDVETGYTPDYNAILMGDGTIDYMKVIEDLTHNQKRFDLVLNKVNSLEGATMVLANRVEYLKELCERYSKRGICLSGQGQSKKAKAERKKALEDLNTGEIDCIFATYQLASEGLDVPNLRYVVFATPEKNETTVKQSAGRVGRKADNKDFGTVIDFVDEFGMYRGWRKKREKIYKELKI